MKPGPGRPTKYNQETVEAILQALRDGNTRKDSCSVAGISEETFSQWRKRYPEFLDSIEKAEGKAAFHAVNVVRSAMDSGVWQAAAWWLERRRKQDWSLRTETVGADGSPLEIVIRYADID
jgi:hypothetical protein